MYVEPIAALFSQRTGKPVKVSLSREEVLTATGPTSGTYVRVKIGAKRDGTLLAGEAELAYEAGSHPPSPVGGGCLTVFGPYDIPNLRVDGYDVVVNKPKVSSYRAPGACQPTLAVESVLDEIAEELAIEPMELRLRNAAREGTRILDGRAFPTIGAVDVMETLRTSEHYRSELSGEYQGRGVAIGYWYNGGGEGTATASIKRRRDREPDRRLGRHRRSARLAGDADGRGAGHPLRGRPPARRRHGVDRLHGADRGLGDHLQDRLGGLQAGAGVADQAPGASGQDLGRAFGAGRVPPGRHDPRTLRTRTAALAPSRSASSRASCPGQAATSRRRPTPTRRPGGRASPGTSSTSRSIRRPGKSTSCVTPRCRTWARRSTPRTWRVRCRAAPRRARGWR